MLHGRGPPANSVYILIRASATTPLLFQSLSEFSYASSQRLRLTRRLSRRGASRGPTGDNLGHGSHLAGVFAQKQE